MPRDFQKLMLARFFFTFGVQMQVIVLGWRMYELTKDPLQLGLIGLMEAIPALSLALFAGYIVDRSRPLTVYRRVVFVSLSSALLMLFCQLPHFGISSEVQVITLYGSSFLSGMARAFSQPSMYSIIPRIIPKPLLPKSSAWMASAMQVARISGPALGGILYGFLGVSGTAFVVCLFLLLTQAILFLIRLQIDPLPPRLKVSVKEELLSGARFVFSHPILFPAMTLDMISVLFGGVTALLPIFAAEVLFVGPKGLGLLRAAPALGAAVMSYLLSQRSPEEKAGKMLFTGVTGYGLCILVFALSRDYTLSLIALILSGAFDSIGMVIRIAAVQLSSPEEMRGRISAVNSIFIGSSNELGEFESGVAASFLGATGAALFGAVACLGTIAATAAFAPKLRRLNLREL